MFSSILIYLLRYCVFLISYVSNSNAFLKPLSPQEEQHLLELNLTGDDTARNKLVEHNLRLVAHIAKKYNSNGSYDNDDLISIGTIGLIKAINSYDGTKKTKLATYAARCIENEILMVMRSNKKTQQDVSLNDCLGHDSDGNEVTFIDILTSNDEEVVDEAALNIDIKKLYKYIDRCLDERERKIIILRYGLMGKPLPQREIAKSLQISRSYVSRIEKKALSKLLSCFNENS